MAQCNLLLMPNWAFPMQPTGNPKQAFPMRPTTNLPALSPTLEVNPKSNQNMYCSHLSIQ